MIIEYKCPECGGPTYGEVLTSYPPINVRRCPKCGWSVSSTEQIMTKVWAQGDPI